MHPLHSVRIGTLEVSPDTAFGISMTIARHLARLQVRIETIAEHNSVPGPAGLSLEDTLSALTPTGRDRVAMLLEKVRAFSNDPDERTAADLIRELAERTWSYRTAG